MAKNKIITSQGNVQFINSKGKTISIHPMHCYAVYQDDTVSFLFIYMKEYSGQAFFSSQFEDLEVDGVTYDSIDALKEAIADAFAKAGAQARTEIVDELPETGYTNTIYLVKKEHGEGYDEYVYNDEKGWQLIGDTDIEFERYLQKVDFNAYSAATEEKIESISGTVIDVDGKINFLSGAVDTEIASREAADAVISGAVDTLSTNLANEVQRAQNAESALQNNINTVNSRVDAEQIARANADNAISGAVDTMGDEAIVDAAYVSTSTTIDFYNADGAVVAQVDATDFIKDGMIEDVRIENGYLIIDFNTASGKQDISIPLTDIFNPANYYDKTAVDGFVSGLNEDISEKLAISDFNTYSGAVETALGNKVETSDFETYSGAVDTAIASKFDASGITAYSTSQEVTAEIEAATSGKVDTTSFTAYSASVETALGNKADLSALTEDEAVWRQALNDLNGRINTISGNALSSGDVQTQIDNSISGKVDTSSVVTAVTSGSTDSEIPTAKAVYDATQSGGGGMTEDDELLLSTALTDLNDRKIDASEVKSNYQKKGDYATKDYVATALEPYEAKANVEQVEKVTSYSLNDLNNKFGGLSLVKITESEYAALTTKDENTLYIVVAD